MSHKGEKILSAYNVINAVSASIFLLLLSDKKGDV